LLLRSDALGRVVGNTFAAYAVRTRWGLAVETKHFFLQTVSPLTVKFIVLLFYSQALKVLVFEFSCCLEEWILNNKVQVKQLMFVVVGK
jgi:hypothetical protein